jgi:hypothetical protein
VYKVDEAMRAEETWLQVWREQRWWMQVWERVHVSLHHVHTAGHALASFVISLKSVAWTSIAMPAHGNEHRFGI